MHENYCINIRKSSNKDKKFSARYTREIYYSVSYAFIILNILSHFLIFQNYKLDIINNITNRKEYI